MDAQAPTTEPLDDSLTPASGPEILHDCAANVVITVYVPDRGEFVTYWCLNCLEDVDPLSAVERLIPGAVTVLSARRIGDL